jgi:hypothetical protein
MTTSCLFLKPQVATAEGREKQGLDIKNFIRPAIEQAGLSAIDNQMDGLEVSDISDDLIQKIYDADVLIMDANCYETSGIFQLSPYLYYYMALGHSRGNITILVTNTIAHLPYNLIKYHTLIYSSTDIWKFINKFKAAIEEIRQGQHEDSPDNPIQNYLHQDALARARRQIAELQAEKAQQKQGKPSITFRKVD